jgi:hypothetical protein
MPPAERPEGNLETDGIVIEGYEPGPIEVCGRRLKMEYVGMASIFVVIAELIFGGGPWIRPVVATAASFYLFLGLKKKNRDHLMCSVLLVSAAVLARPAVMTADWAWSLMLFGATIFSLERYLEKRPQQVYYLPLVIGIWAWIDGAWLLGLVYAAIYLTYRRTDRQGAATILVRSVAAAAVTGGVVTIVRLMGTNPPDGYWLIPTIQPGQVQLWVTAGLVLAVLVVLAAYWSRLIPPHRINPLVFAALAPWDLRLTAMFAMVAAVLFAATIFRLSIDSDRLRPFIWHAEWHFFYLVFGLAVWSVVFL